MNDQACCERCGIPTPSAVYRDTAGICRGCQKNTKTSVALPDLARLLRAPDKRYVGVYFDEYRKRNWLPISASMRTLAKIGTQEGTLLLQEIRDKWYHDFSKNQQRIADKLLEKSLSTSLQRTTQ